MNRPAPVPRLALIGLSGYGRIHLELARECRDRGEARIVAAAVINPEAEAANVAELQGHGTAIHADYAAMLRRHAGEIDLCLIPTGIHLHAPMTREALRAGANVLVEKPLCGSLAEARDLLVAERAAGRFVAVGFQDCSDPGTRWLAAALAGGAIGEVRTVRFLGIWPRKRAYFRRNDWAGKLRTGGAAVLDSPLNNAFAHFVLLSLLFAGEGEEDAAPQPEGVELLRAHAIESFDTAVVTLRTARGVRLWFGASHASHAALEPEILIEGTAGTACWRYEQEAWVAPTGGARERRPVGHQEQTRRAMMAAVLARWRGAAAPICTAAMAARHTGLIETIHATAPVHGVAAEQVIWMVADDDANAVPAVAGLDAALRLAYARQCSLREAGFDALAPALAH